MSVRVGSLELRLPALEVQRYWWVEEESSDGDASAVTRRDSTLTIERERAVVFLEILEPPGGGGGGGSSDEAVEKEKKGDDICPWDSTGSPGAVDKKKLLPASSLVADDSAACPWDSLGRPSSRKNSTQFDSGSSSSDISLAVAAEVSERLKKNCNVQDRFGRRASSCTTKLQEGPRPSVSSMEDFAPPVPTPQRSFDSISCEGANLPVEVPDRVRKKSVSGPPGRKQSTTMAPVISVSSVAENAEGMEEGEEPTEPEPEVPVVAPTENVPTEPVLQDSAPGKTNDICPWEDEDSCKVDTPFVKTYVTLDYL
ncbi:regulation of calcium ion export across plasma membrane [Homalodisca vitripennis]|nr:regulation of calcium ion export across plasma membrane [Homalodisca vitripennis]